MAGLIPEDNKVALARNGKPSKAYREALKPASPADMERLVVATLEALIRGEEFLLLKTSYLFKWPDDFPKGKIIRQEGKEDIRTIRCRKLLEWLRNRGHTTMTLSSIRGLRLSVGKAIHEI